MQHSHSKTEHHMETTPITTPAELVARATWNAIDKSRGKGDKAVVMRRKAWTIVWTADVFNALPEHVKLGLINHSSSTDVMARAKRDANPDASDDDVKAKLANQIFGLRNGARGTTVVEKKTLVFPGYTVTFAAGEEVDTVRVYSDALAAAVDIGIPNAVAEKMILDTFAANGLEV